MKQGTLRIGIKGQAAIAVPVQNPENVEDLKKLCKGNEEVLVRWAKRGLNIERQERSGARDAIRENPKIAPDAVAKIVHDFDPTVVKPRTGGGRKPKTVNLTPGKKSYTPEELRKLLESAGVNATLVEA